MGSRSWRRVGAALLDVDARLQEDGADRATEQIGAVALRDQLGAAASTTTGGLLESSADRADPLPGAAGGAG